MIRITYLGHSTVLLQEGETRIIIDPWLKGNPSCPEAFQKLPKIDYIVLTHGHSDHTGSALELASQHSAKVFANYELGMLLIKDGLADSLYQQMNKGGTVEVDNISVSLTNAYHSSSYDALDGNTYYAGEACGAVIKLPSGKYIYHAGDTSLFKDMKYIGKRFNPEIAFLPIGDRFTMGPEDAAFATKWLRPKIVVPIHYGTFPLLTGTPEKFQACLDQVFESKKENKSEHEQDDKKIKTILKVLKPGEGFDYEIV